MDGKCLRGARRPDGSQVFVLSAVHQGDGVALASREIGAKINEIAEFAAPLDQIDTADLARTAGARRHRTMENTVRWVRDTVFGENKSQVRTHNTPAMLAVVRDLIRSLLKLAGYVSTATCRRAHTERPGVLAPSGNT